MEDITPPDPCKDSITIFPFVWSFEDVQPCYDFSSVEAAPGKNIIGAFLDEVTGGTYTYTINPRTGSFAYIFSSYNNSNDYNQYMISPCIVAPAENALKIGFWYKKLASDSESFKVGYSSTDNDIKSFIWTSAITDASTSWKSDTLTVPAGTKYIAINYYSNYKYFLAIDDLTIDTLPVSQSGGGENPQPDGKTYTLVTSAAQLVAGGKYIVAGVKSNLWYGLGYQRENNRGGIALGVTKSSAPETVNAEAAIISTDTTKIYQITLGGTSGAYTLYDAVNAQYLAAVSSSNNYLKLSSGPKNWTITINGTTSVATLTCTADNYSRNKIRFNTDGNNTLFSCYASGQQDVYLYRLIPPESLDTDEIQANICYGETYTENGFNVSTAGTHYSILQNLSGADSVVLELNLTVSSEPVADGIDTAICAGGIFTYNNVDYTESEIIRDTLRGTFGCDSVYRIVNLTVLKTDRIEIDTAICKNCTFTYNNIDYTKDTVIKDTLHGVMGCDSVYITINLTVELSVNGENIAAAAYKIYPNPSDGIINIEVAEPSLVEIFAISGVRVFRKQVTETARFSLQNKGVYIVRVTDGSGVYTGKVIVK
jgi:hypothetical protein